MSACVISLPLTAAREVWSPEYLLPASFLFPENRASYEAISKFGREFPMCNIDFREVTPSPIGSTSHLQKSYWRIGLVLVCSKSTKVFIRT